MHALRCVAPAGRERDSIGTDPGPEQKAATAALQHLRQATPTPEVHLSFLVNIIILIIKTCVVSMGAASTHLVLDADEGIHTPSADHDTAVEVWNMQDIPVHVRANLVCVALGARDLYYLDGSVTQSVGADIRGKIEHMFDIRSDRDSWWFRVVKLGSIDRLGLGVFDLKRLGYEFYNQKIVNFGAAYFRKIRDTAGYNMTEAEGEFSATDMIPSISVDFVVFNSGEYEGHLFSQKSAMLMETAHVRELYKQRQRLCAAIKSVAPTFSVELWMQPAFTSPTYR